MLMLNYDFYDIYAVLLSFRNDPSSAHNVNISKNIKLLIDSPQVDNTIESNISRRSLAKIEAIDSGQLDWIRINNVYTYGQKVIKDEIAYRVLSKAFEELLLCLKNKSYDRFEDLSDALHNIPIILVENRKNSLRRIKGEISSYRKKWNSSFLKERIK